MSWLTPPPYRTGLASGLGVVLPAGLVLAVVDILHTGGGFGPMLPLLGLWSLITLPVALATGVVLGAGNATWGEGWVVSIFRRLRNHAEFDRSVSAVVVAAALLGGCFAVAIGWLAVGLVGEVQRKAVGGLLLGVAVVVALPVLALTTVPLYRVARLITARIPTLGPLSRTVLVMIGVALAGVAAALHIIFRRLDYQALNLASLFVPLLLPLIAIAIGLVAYGRLSDQRERLPHRGLLALAGAAIAAVLPIIGLGGGTPSPSTEAAVVDASLVGSRMIRGLRKLVDLDGDGYSALFGGPDCDDGNAAVYPSAAEIPGNGLDDNCVGGDARREPAAPAAPPPVHNAATTPPPSAPQPPPDPPAGNPDAKNVLILFVDTLRGDRLGVMGYQREGKSLTPRLDELARESVTFRNAYSQAPNTPRSVPSFLASRYPSQIEYDKRFKNYATVLDSNETLFEVLRPAGFRTIGKTSHFYFCDRKRDPESCPDVQRWMKSNISQGADEWDNSGALSIAESNRDSAGPRTVKKTIARLEKLAASRTRFAMMVHLFEPHSTYIEQPGYTYKERKTAALSEKYDYEIAYTDTLIGELLDALDATGLTKSTMVVVLADHGEAFGAHTIAGKPAFFHGDSLYRELIHVPLIFRVPGAAPCMRDDVVQLLDVAPTIAAMVGVAPAQSWQGRSLAPALACKPLEPRPAFSELLPAPDWDHEAKSMVTADGRHHVYYRISDSKWEIFDLHKDPGESTNLSDGPNATALQHALGAWMEGPLAAGGGN